MGQGMRLRIGLVSGLLGLILGALCFRLGMLQVVCHAQYASVAEAITHRQEERKSPRGTIFYGDGSVLAFDRPVFDLHCYLQRLLPTKDGGVKGLVRDLTRALAAERKLTALETRKITKILMTEECRHLKRRLLTPRKLTATERTAIEGFLPPSARAGFRASYPPAKILGWKGKLLVLKALAGTELEKALLATGSLSRSMRQRLIAALSRRLKTDLEAQIMAGCLLTGPDRTRILAHLYRKHDRILLRGIAGSRSLVNLYAPEMQKKWRAANLTMAHQFIRAYAGERSQVGGGIFSTSGGDNFIGLERACAPGGPLAPLPATKRRQGKVGLYTSFYLGDWKSSPMPGAMHTTLDPDLQSRLSSILEREAEEHQPDWAAALIMDIHNGDLLGMASSPPLVSGARASGKSREEIVGGRRNHCLESRYEPGSVMKSFIIAAALEEKILSVDSSMDCSWNCPTGWKIPGCGRTIRDDHRLDPAVVPLAQVLIQSSNIGAVKVGRLIPREDYVSWLQLFGLHRASGLTYTMELKPNFKSVFALVDPKLRNRWEAGFLRWTGPSVSFGYSLEVNLVNLASCFCSLANGGFRVRPRLVKTLISQTGKRESFPARGRKQILSSGVAGHMRDLLGRVVSDPKGTGYKMAGEIGRGLIGGKTGTSFRKRSGKRVYWATFIGFAPLENPRYLAAAVFYKENTSRFYGGSKAGPTVRDILLHATARGGSR